jgi:hypothetical protein
MRFPKKPSRFQESVLKPALEVPASENVRILHRQHPSPGIENWEMENGKLQERPCHCEERSDKAIVQATACL